MTQSNGSLLARLRSLPLRYRLILPFLSLAFFGTFSLVWTAILSQNKIISQQEQQRLTGAYQSFLHSMDLRGRWAASLASTHARNPEIAAALAQRDRMQLIRLCYPAYQLMKHQYGLSQFHFEVRPGRSFLRLHHLSDFGDLLGDQRSEVRDALVSREAVYGLEKGLTGYGIRGVAPVEWEGEVVGAIDLGFEFGPIFIEEVKQQSDVELAVLIAEPGDGPRFIPLAATRPELVRSDPTLYAAVFGGGDVEFSIKELATDPFALLIGPVRNYRGEIVALVELGLNRSRTLQVIVRYRRWMLGLGLIGMAVSVWAITVVTSLFTRPITRMTSLARDIAAGRQMQRIEEAPSGELGVLAEVLNEMLSSLDASRRQIKDYADTLEERVEVRTRALQESEEKYRTLVESVPLVVYRLVGGGRTVFINSFIEELTGVTAPAATADQQFWKNKVYREDRDRIWPLMDRCLEHGEEFKAEYRIRHRNGKFVFVFDHALPVVDETGEVELIDGILVNVSDRYRLQQQILQTEELRTLSEISARLAHEIRNPLAVAGGFARRLLNKLPAGDENRKKAEIILKEVERLEKLLEKSLAYLRPFELAPTRTSLNDLVQSVFRNQGSLFQQLQVAWSVNPAADLEPLPLDRELLAGALTTMIEALLAYCEPEQSRIECSTSPGENSVVLELTISGVQLSDDDLEHFFYPFTSRLGEAKSVELPMAKMIIQKHKGVLKMTQTAPDQVRVTLNLPLS
ncbi:MAG: hypothetical protein AUK55_06120 [Syntrophobacteraceae bacterium CG2_30_61_12]|nr:MAG: hypothetical protein AUK55_06120 [Syntrophobacteraceae bacterium CG2_30_61_12]